MNNEDIQEEIFNYLLKNLRFNKKYYGYDLILTSPAGTDVILDSIEIEKPIEFDM